MTMAARDARRGDYPYGIGIPTRWMDCDAYGHVNNVIYYSWFDTAVTAMLIERGVIVMHHSPSIGLCVESHCEYLAPVEFPETIEARVRVGRVGDKSLRYEIGLFRAGRDEPAAAGYFVHVFVDRASRRPVPLTAAQKAAVMDLVRSE
jgi:acyl-CoA thioester hydrolase